MAKRGKSTKTKTSKDPRLDNAYMAWVDDIRQATDVMIQRSKADPSVVATEAKVCVSTLRNFVSGKTMAPRADTLFGITRALDIPFGIPESFKKRYLTGRR